MRRALQLGWLAALCYAGVERARGDDYVAELTTVLAFGAERRSVFN